MTERRKIAKWALYAVTAILFSVAEARFMPYIRVFGVSPGFGAALTAAVAMFEGGTGGAFFGLACGALGYLAPGDSELVYMLVYMLGGYAAGVLGNYMFRRGLAALLLWTLIIDSAATLVYFIFIVLLPRRAGLSVLFSSGLAHIVMSTAAAVLVYFPIRETARRFGYADQ